MFVQHSTNPGTVSFKSTNQGERHKVSFHTKVSMPYVFWVHSKIIPHLLNQNLCCVDCVICDCMEENGTFYFAWEDSICNLQLETFIICIKAPTLCSIPVSAPVRSFVLLKDVMYFFSMSVYLLLFCTQVNEQKHIIFYEAYFVPHCLAWVFGACMQEIRYRNK